MKNKSFAFLVAAGLAVAALGAATPPADSNNLTALAQKAVSEDPQVSANAIAALRAHGPAGLEALLSAHAQLISQYKVRGEDPLPPEWLRLEEALSRVSGQRDCQASGLYWYTDFGQAQAAAKASGKPILSLRLLGRLDEEYSCANSRFFRTTLYANAEVSQYLRDHFILHWKSVRPVPLITIDFGDGRKIERTITGNSIHYILDAEGRPIDALPGLYGPKAFLKGLADAEGAARQAAALTGTARNQFLWQYHRDRYAAIVKNWNADLRAIGGAPATSLASASDATWDQIASLHRGDAVLDGPSKALIKFKNPTAQEAMRVTTSKGIVEAPMVIELSNLQRSIAADTVRNEYLLHSQIHQWLGYGTPQLDVEPLNRRVYAELFLTPETDPWLGLAPANIFTGLPNNGLVGATSAH